MKIPPGIKNIRWYVFLGILWLALALFYDLLKYQHTFSKQFLNGIWQTIYILLLNYVFFEYALPVIIRKRSMLFFNIGTAIIFLIVQLLLLSFGLYAWTKLGMTIHVYTQFRFTTITGGAYAEFIEAVLNTGESGLASFLFFGVAKLLHYNFNLRQAARKLRFEKQEAELNFLKSQTNPHFLFNTLNNIYALTREKSDLAPESVLRLSKILRFMIYETNVEFISIEKEVEIIEDYIALEKLRYDESLRVEFKRQVDEMKQALPPLLLMPLVENAFKHGASEAGEPFVEIDLKVVQHQLLFVVKNSADVAADEYTGKGNIGLTNLRRQLELLYTKHELFTQHRDGVFTASLKIDLQSHV